MTIEQQVKANDIQNVVVLQGCRDSYGETIYYIALTGKHIHGPNWAPNKPTDFFPSTLYLFTDADNEKLKALQVVHGNTPRGAIPMWALRYVGDKKFESHITQLV